MCVDSRFTAAQAAQKQDAATQLHLDMFTAAQAAQKKKPPKPMRWPQFTAAQAAQKDDTNNDHC